MRSASPGRALPGWRQPGIGWAGPRFLRRWRPSPRMIFVGVVALLVLGGIWLWVRDSPLVSVRRVTVTGAAGPDANAIRAALVNAARGMSTLSVDQGQLKAVLAPYPEVKGLRVSPQLPHGLRIEVIEQLPVAQVVADGRSEAVSADGTLLGSQRTAWLPQIDLPVPPGGPRLIERPALDAVRALGAAPYQLLGRISQIRESATHGLVAQLRSGPSVYLGDTSHLHAKWLAALVVLADPGSAGAVYLDVSDPHRPVAGAGAPTAGTSGPAASSTGSTAALAGSGSAAPTGSPSASSSTGG